MDIQIDLKRGDFEAMHPTAKTFNFDAVKMTYIGNCADVKRLNELWSTWCACIGLVYLEASVPEGFVLMPKEPTLKLSVAYEQNSIAPISSLSVSGYRAMIEAQEPSND